MWAACWAHGVDGRGGQSTEFLDAMNETQKPPRTILPRLPAWSLQAMVHSEVGDGPDDLAR